MGEGGDPPLLQSAPCPFPSPREGIDKQCLHLFGESCSDFGNGSTGRCPQLLVVATVSVRRAASMNVSLSRSEIPEKMHLCHEAWTPENELLTAQLKLKRPAVAKYYKEQIDKMCAE